MREQRPQEDPRKGLPERVQLYLSFGEQAHNPDRSNHERVIFDIRQLEVLDTMTTQERDALADYGTKLQQGLIMGKPIQTIHDIGEHI